MTCAPMVEHHYATRSSSAYCPACRRRGPAVTWTGEHPTSDELLAAHHRFLAESSAAMVGCTPGAHPGSPVPSSRPVDGTPAAAGHARPPFDRPACREAAAAAIATGPKTLADLATAMLQIGVPVGLIYFAARLAVSDLVEARAITPRVLANGDAVWGQA